LTLSSSYASGLGGRNKRGKGRKRKYNRGQGVNMKFVQPISNSVTDEKDKIFREGFYQKGNYFAVGPKGAERI
jgi:hypothetical protein